MTNEGSAHVGDGARVSGPVVGLNAGTINYHAPQPVAPSLSLRQLRAPTPDFVGRVQETDRLVTALSGVGAAGTFASISGVRGMGGIGKTELAYVVGQRLSPIFPDAQLVIDLQGSRSAALAPERVLQTIIQAFYPEAQLPDDLPSLVTRYRAVLTGRRVLIIADDARDAAQVRALATPPGSVLLITSRNRFVLPGMLCIDLEMLDDAEALYLLQQIAPALSEDQAEAIGHACGNHPLALRIAASVLASGALNPDRYLARLADERKKLAALRDPDEPDNPDLSVEASLALSYALLDDSAQAMLRSCGLFAADFDRAAVGALLDVMDDDLVEAGLDLLHRRSLVAHDRARQRYDLHELVRVFALARLRDTDADTEAAMRIRHAAWYIHVANDAEAQFVRDREGVSTGLVLFDSERTHIDAAWKWLLEQPPTPTIDDLVIRYGGALPYIGRLRYHPRVERIPQFYAALAAARRLNRKESEGQALSGLANTYARLGDLPTARFYYGRALATLGEIGNRKHEGRMFGNLGNIYRRMGQKHVAMIFYEVSLAFAEETYDLQGQADAIGNLGIGYAEQNPVERAIYCFKKQLALSQGIRYPEGESHAFNGLGVVYGRLGQFPEAIKCHENVVAITRSMGDKRGEGLALANLAGIQDHLQQYDHAVTNAERASVLLAEVESPDVEEVQQRLIIYRRHQATMRR